MPNTDNREPTDSERRDAEGYYKAYEGHSAILRTWLVAYGIGAPVLFMTNESIQNQVADSALQWWIAGFFLTGVFLQIVITALNKYAMWTVQHGLLNPSYQETHKYKRANAVKDRIDLDFWIDMGTIVLFLLATAMLFAVAVGNDAGEELDTPRKPTVVQDLD